MTKITLATIKSFIKKNINNLYIQNLSDFDSTIDGISACNNKSFKKTIETLDHTQHSLGIKDAWFVLGSRDYFQNYEDKEFIGFDVSNCCGHFVLAIKKS